MQAVRCLLRSRQELQSKGLSAALQSSGALSAWQGLGIWDPANNAIAVPHSVHGQKASLTTLSGYLRGATVARLQQNNRSDFQGAQQGTQVC